MHVLLCPLQLRLSEVVEGTQQLFVDLADSSDIFTAQVTPHSFYNGLSRKGVSYFLTYT